MVSTKHIAIHARNLKHGVHISIPVPENASTQYIANLVKGIGNTLKQVMEPASEPSVTYHEHSSISNTWPEYMCYHPFENHFVNHLK